MHCLLVLLLAVPLLVPARGCPRLESPVAGEIVRVFAPVGRYGGHWGVDFAAEPGTAVGAADAGEVTFAGEVAGVLSVTVHHGGGLRSSYSYLQSVSVARGAWIQRGDAIGYSGTDHDLAAVHFSVRIGDRYHDPEDWLRCLNAPSKGLSLVPIDPAYAAPRAARNPRRNVRSATSGASVCR